MIFNRIGLNTPKNNRKTTRGRNRQVIYLKNDKGNFTGKTKIIMHLPQSPNSKKENPFNV